MLARQPISEFKNLGENKQTRINYLISLPECSLIITPLQVLFKIQQQLQFDKDVQLKTFSFNLKKEIRIKQLLRQQFVSSTYLNLNELQNLQSVLEMLNDNRLSFWHQFIKRSKSDYHQIRNKTNPKPKIVPKDAKWWQKISIYLFDSEIKTNHTQNQRFLLDSLQDDDPSRQTQKNQGANLRRLSKKNLLIYESYMLNYLININSP